MALVRRIRPSYTTDEPITSHDPPVNLSTDPDPVIGTAIDDAATRDEAETVNDDDVELPVAAADAVTPTRANWRVFTPTTWSNPMSEKISETSGIKSGIKEEKASEIPTTNWDAKKAQNADTTASHAATVAPLFSDLEIRNLRTTWETVQASFVDTPRHSVEEADKLVAAVMQRFASRFATERATLEQRWRRGEEVSTEDLRMALKHYRAFFGKLLNAA
jgi:hypothetical protein